MTVEKDKRIWLFDCPFGGIMTAGYIVEELKKFPLNTKVSIGNVLAPQPIVALIHDEVRKQLIFVDKKENEHLDELIKSTWYRKTENDS